MNRSGQILLDGGVIRFRSKDYKDWDLTLSDLRVIGEATNQDGPWVEDYFLCFASNLDMWYEAPTSAEGMQEFLRNLAALLDGSLRLELCNSTDFKSRVMWPPELIGEPMFRYDRKRPMGLLGKLFGLWIVRQTYSDGVTAVLAKRD